MLLVIASVRFQFLLSPTASLFNWGLINPPALLPVDSNMKASRVPRTGVMPDCFRMVANSWVVCNALKSSNRFEDESDRQRDRQTEEEREADGQTDR